MELSTAEKILVYCIPFAGGSKSSFQSYTVANRSPFQFIALEAPGRGNRWTEPLLQDLPALLTDYTRQLTDLNTKHTGPYILWGHSMGATITSCLTACLLQTKQPLPELLLQTSKVRPSTRRAKPLHELQTDDFIDALTQMGGLPAFLQERPQLIAGFLPIIRADIQAIETYNQPLPSELPVPVRILNSRLEEPAESDWKIWQRESSLAVSYQSVDGNHFFINRNQSVVFDELSHCLTSVSNHGT